jgi:hypothetical protein
MNWQQLINFANGVDYIEDSSGRKNPIYQNPSKETINTISKHLRWPNNDLRVLLDHTTGKAHVWQAGKMTHEDAADKLGLAHHEHSRIHFDMLGNHGHVTNLSEKGVKDHPYIKSIGADDDGKFNLA